MAKSVFYLYYDLCNFCKTIEDLRLIVYNETYTFKKGDEYV